VRRLQPRDRTRLALVAAKFQSPFDGERLAALEAFHRLLVAAGTSWPEILKAEPGEGPAPVETMGEGGHDPDHLATIHTLARDGRGVLTDWERSFLVGIAAAGRLSTKQQATLDGIVRKVAAVAAVREAAP
jgi:hypothetical protein